MTCCTCDILNWGSCPLQRGSGVNSICFPLFECIKGELESAMKKTLMRAPEC